MFINIKQCRLYDVTLILLTIFITMLRLRVYIFNVKIRTIFLIKRNLKLSF